MTHTPDSWTHVDDYLNGLLLAEDPVLEATLKANAAAGLPEIGVAPNQGKLLQFLVRISGARKVLEIGTLGGYSTTWIGRGLPQGGTITTLEASPEHASVARSNLERAGLGERVDLRVAPALESLPVLVAEGAGPFDFVFIDADKKNDEHYLEWALKLTRPGSIILCDNVVRGGSVADPSVTDPDTRGIREFLSRLGREPGLDALALQTVGAKGWDGFALAIVR
jgi:predicted O-methyltransferase YrrM